MILGVMSGMRVLIWAVVLLFLCIYVLGVVMVKLDLEDEREFGTLASSMFTMFRCFTDGCVAYDGTPVIERVRGKLGNFGTYFMIFYMLSFVFVTIGIFNLIMA